MRTYARLSPGTAFTYEAWKEAIRHAETFVTYGPLLEFSVEGLPMGSRIEMPANSGTVDVPGRLPSATIPMRRVDLVVNGGTVGKAQRYPPGIASGKLAGTGR